MCPEFQCTSILDIKHGVCKDSDLSHSDSTQLLEARRIGSLTGIKYRRQLTRSEENDKEFNLTSPVSLIFAVGKLFENGDLGFHRIWNKVDRTIDFTKPSMECKDFVLMGNKDL
jgi:hypothetical protein